MTPSEVLVKAAEVMTERAEQAWKHKREILKIHPMVDGQLEMFWKAEGEAYESAARLLKHFANDKKWLDDASLRAGGQG